MTLLAKLLQKLSTPAVFAASASASSVVCKHFSDGLIRKHLSQNPGLTPTLFPWGLKAQPISSDQATAKITTR